MSVSYDYAKFICRPRESPIILSMELNWHLDAAQNAAEKLIEGGICGILNFSPTIIKNVDKNIEILNIDIAHELMFLASKIFVNKSDCFTK